MRIYILINGDNEQEFISLTSYLSVLDREWFKKWKKKEKRWEGISEYGKLKGTMLHNKVEDYYMIEGAKSNDVAERPSEEEQFHIINLYGVTYKTYSKLNDDLYTAFKKWVSYHPHIKVVLVEWICFSFKYNFGCTIDIIAFDTQQKTWLNIDVKTTKYKSTNAKTIKKWGMQTAAQIVALEECIVRTDDYPWKHCILQIPPDKMYGSDIRKTWKFYDDLSISEYGRSYTIEEHFNLFLDARNQFFREEIPDVEDTKIVRKFEPIFLIAPEEEKEDYDPDLPEQELGGF